MNSIWKYSYGEPETHTPVTELGKRLDEKRCSVLPDSGEAPFTESDIMTYATARSFTLRIPVDPEEIFFGLGLQLKSVCQKNKKLTLRVNSDPKADLGDSHAPVPFFVSSAGYGVFVDTARYCSFYFSSHFCSDADGVENRGEGFGADTTEQLYTPVRSKDGYQVIIDVPSACGVDIYVFGGPTMLDAVKRYNLFSGGGCTPPLYGLGVWYRTWWASDEATVARQTESLRESRMPCDVYGIENAWMTHTYSCTYVWDPAKFPDPEGMISKLREKHFHTNVWEHIFVHPEAPIYKELKPYSGNYKVWNGLVPDLSLPEARRIFEEYHRDYIIGHGICGYKLDECDNSDWIPYPWSYPEASVFPSGLDGEQMHSLMGRLFQETMLAPYSKSNTRSYHQVRSSGAFAAPMPYVLYSDLYDHRDYVRGMVNAGYSGLLWSPEVHDASSLEDLIRRVQTVIMSPIALFTIWFMPNPPWLQIDAEKNRKGELMECRDEATDICRSLLELRMSLIPYLYAAFRRYENEGIPPFRGLPLDYPNDAATYAIEDEYMVGGDLLFAPIFAGESKRTVYLPAGVWYDFFTGRELVGGTAYEFEAKLTDMLLFVKHNALIPLAEPVRYVPEDEPWPIRFVGYGDGAGRAELYEDDGLSFAYRNGNERVSVAISDGEALKISVSGGYEGRRYKISPELELRG